MTDTPRNYPSRPILSVGAVVISGEAVLLVRRGQEPRRGEWSLPGGAVEVGETLVAAVQREVFEETGLLVDVGRLVEVLDRIYTDGDGRVEYHYVLIDYACQPIAGQLEAGSDALDVRWVVRTELSLFGLTPGTLAVIDKAFGLPADRG